jgi:hypothetical protein
VTSEDIQAAKAVLESVFLARAWDLAAHYAGSATGWGADLRGVVDQLVSDQSRRNRLASPGGLREAILDLLDKPSDGESALLAAIGRAAFGIQLVISSPRQALIQRFALPQRIYLDASVLMPAIVPGHPLRSAYVGTLRRLSEAGAASGVTTSVVVGKQFLNEIVVHRRKAIDVVEQQALEASGRLARHIQFYGATNTNVFIGAWASHVGRQGAPISFQDFLSKHAPYETEEALGEYLSESMSLTVLGMRALDEYATVFSNILGWLSVGYAGTKASVLVEHEAQQLTQLQRDLKMGVRSVFVTSDNHLRRILQQAPELRVLAGMTVSHLGLVALVDVLVGLDVDTRSLARLMWAAPYQGEEDQVFFEYFVQRGLREYAEGMAMEMQDVAHRVAAHAGEEARRGGVNLFGEDPRDVAATAKLLDRYEEQFFQSWREAVDRRERDENEHR